MVLFAKYAIFVAQNNNVMKSESRKKQLSFSTITFLDIKKAVSIRQFVIDEPFQIWFNTPTTYEDTDVQFLQNLISKHRNNLSSYSVEELKMKFIGPILNRVDFNYLSENPLFL
jgi:hypothetical protein